jgi:hypothetical protein
MEAKRGTKHLREHANRSLSSSSDTFTPPPSPTRSSPPSASPLEVSSWRVSSLTYEHDDPSKGFSVEDISSGEDDALPDTSRDEEIARKLFGDLNHELVGLPGDGNVIILSNSDEEGEVHEGDATDAEAMPSSAINSPALTVSAVDDADAPKGVLVIGMAVAPPIECKMMVVTVGMMPVCLRLLCQLGCLQEVCTEEFKNNNDLALLHHKFFYKEEWGQ